MQSTADELAEKTLSYWRVSRARNGLSAMPIMTEMALYLMNDLIFGFNPSRPLVRMASNLSAEIVEDSSTLHAEPAVLLSFEALARSK